MPLPTKSYYPTESAIEDLEYIKGELGITSESQVIQLALRQYAKLLGKAQTEQGG